MKKISYYLFSNNALFTFIKGIISIVGKTTVAELGLKVFQDLTIAKFADFDLALKRDHVDPLTQKLNQADQNRDHRFIGFKSYIAACQYRKDAAWHEEAKKIDRVIHRYGGDLYRMANAEESAALDNLIGDLKTEPYSTAITTIEATNWLAEMESAQQDYKALGQQRVEQTDTNTNTIGDTRKPLINANKSLLSMIELQNQATANPALKDLIEQINNHIAKSMASARLSNSLNEKEDLVEEAQND
tara:strand:+ start:7221 stop:7955 length:735 start_codon:yes stop_codon:yes gene_type:complete